MTEQATQAQIKALQKLKLHPEPWTLSKREAWAIMDEHFKGKEKFEKNLEKFDNAPVVRPGEPQKTQPRAPEPGYKECHLSPEQVNTNALQCAIEVSKYFGYSKEEPERVYWNEKRVMKLAKEFKEFIENGN